MGTLDRTINRNVSHQNQQDPETNISLEEAKKRLQKVTQNATPLGKVLEFLEKDLQDMQKEYLHWEKQEKDTLVQLGKDLFRKVDS